MSVAQLLAKHGTDGTFHRLEKTATATGASTETHVPDASTVRVWAQPISSQKADERGVKNVLTSHLVYVEADPGVLQEGDKIVTSADTFIVLSAPQDQAGLGRVFLIECVQET